VLGRALVAQLQHLAEDGDPAALAAHGGQRLQPGAHRVRVGVVGVVHDDDAVRAPVHLHPPAAGRRGRGQPGRDHLWRQPELPADRGRGERVAHVMGAVQPQRDLGRSLRGDQAERGSCRVVQPDPLGPHLSRRRPAESHHPGPGARGHRGDEGVVGVEHGQPVRGQRLDQLALGLRGGLPAAEHPGVRSPDVQHDPDGGRRNRAQVADVAWSPGTHLEHQESGLHAAAQRGQRHAELVVV
jgi:hypothetical protein